MKQILKNILPIAFAASFVITACEEDDITPINGTFPETGGIGMSMGILRSINYAESPLIDLEQANASDELRIELTEPAIQASTYTVAIDGSQVDTYNEANKTEYKSFPSQFVTLSNEGKLTLESGKQLSNTITTTFVFNESLETGTYLLPLTVKANNGTSTLSQERNTLYYKINVWGETMPEYEWTEKNYIQIVGVDPELTNPLIINKLYIFTSSMPTYYFNVADIVNLQFATVRKDESNLPYLYLKNDLEYVLSHRNKYIAPLQQAGHKVCIAIKGGKEGIGFSNLDEYQMNIFIYKIKEIVDKYHLDGVNLYDYEFEIKNIENNFDLSKGLCKFVASLRKTLGSDKIISYTQTKESPEGIMNDQSEIKLGNFVDYAWTDQLNKIINPWEHPDSWWSKPIAGISKEKWGALNSDIHLTNEELGYLMDEIENNLSMTSEEINHVFVVNRVENVSLATDGRYGWYMVWGSDNNLFDDYDVTQIGPAGANGYGNIYKSLAPKDY